MAEDLIRYDILAQDALRGMVRKVLSEVARTGLPGEHHFYISFMTRAPGVRVSSRLVKEHPEEMTIVLQHQFWDLTVNEQAFEVGLSFGGIPERLYIPFAALTAFFDPSVEFGLKFTVAARQPVAAEPEADGDAEPALPSRKPVPALKSELAPEPKPAAPQPEPAEPPTGEAQVVSLDAFRKKH